MKKVPCLTLCTALLFLFACAIPASAVILQVTVRGTVADVSSANNTLTLSGPSQYGCDYGSGTSAPVCSWTPLNTSTLTGTLPDPAALSVFAKGDQAVAVSLGGTGGTWISLAKLYGSGASADDATDEIGDIGSLPTALIGDYAVSATTAPELFCLHRDDLHGHNLERDCHEREDDRCTKNAPPRAVALLQRQERCLKRQCQLRER